MLGLLVLLKGHNGDLEIARLGDDLDLEIDEILPAVEFAEVLNYLKVDDGRASLTESGKKLLAGSIRSRKTLIREALRKTKLYATLQRALESAPDQQLTDEQVNQLVAFTTAPADDWTQNIINWGRYAEMFRYDAEAGVLHLARTGSGRSSPEGGENPPAGRARESPSGGGRTGSEPTGSTPSRLASLALGKA